MNDRDCKIRKYGDPSGTRTPDSLSPTDIPIFLKKGQNLVLFSERLRVGSSTCLRATHRQVELALMADILLLSLIGQPWSEGSFVRRSWGKLYEEQAIDKREYIEHRFSIF
ncbi:MAG: hypothetical protein C3F12_04625 [Candidatus Methylomirabilota bacterium]|nr:hypothetical protein [candidate division NC10 bacterium]PWB47265.1 MAG: hypothetical protein C3F12_04625 [candidate division NC10 bacterium]